MSVDNFLPLFPPEEVVKNSFLYLAAGEEYPLEKLLEKLISWGYERVSMVTSQGEISGRGDILDVYAPGYVHPVRIEFFGDFIENMRLFEPISQRSKQYLNETLILPVAPDLMEKEYKEKAREKNRKALGYRRDFQGAKIPFFQRAGRKQSLFFARTIL